MWYIFFRSFTQQLSQFIFEALKIVIIECLFFSSFFFISNSLENLGQKKLLKSIVGRQIYSRNYDFIFHFGKNSQKTKKKKKNTTESGREPICNCDYPPIFKA